MSRRIVVALGGNALGSNLPEQMAAVKITARAIVDLIEEGNEVVIVHGNGPQVGMIANAMAELTRSDPEKYIPCPLSVCGAMSQGYIGYDLQNALREEMLDRGMNKGVATVLTQIQVDPADPAFENPTKPIGPFMSEEEADKLTRERDYDFMHDEKKGYRRVVASPKPVSIVELDTISALVESDHVVVCCGGGGIPVIPTEGHHLKGAAAVIDKDFAAEKLAEQLDADSLVILNNRLYDLTDCRKKGKRIVLTARSRTNGSIATLQLTPRKDGSCLIALDGDEAQRYVRTRPGTVAAETDNGYGEDFFRRDSVCLQGYLNGYDPRLGFDSGILYLKDEITRQDYPTVVPINPDGSFQCSFLLRHPVCESLTLNNIWIPFYAEPGDTVTLYIDWEDVMARSRARDMNYPLSHTAYMGKRPDLSYLATTLNKYFQYQTRLCHDFESATDVDAWERSNGFLII